ncbi:NADH:ubiquinone oxidoreductase subunit M [compost metagenome]
MTIFVGSFQHADTFHRVATIVAASSIVITAVYILRVVGILLLGPIKNNHYLELKDAVWFEKLGTVTLVVAIAVIGIAPLWLSSLIREPLAAILQQLIN